MEAFGKDLVFGAYALPRALMGPPLRKATTDDLSSRRLRMGRGGLGRFARWDTRTVARARRPCQPPIRAAAVAPHETKVQQAESRHLE